MFEPPPSPPLPPQKKKKKKKKEKIPTAKNGAFIESVSLFRI